MQSDNNIITGLAPVNPIRVETVLPRFPIHRLAKHGNVIIDIREESEDGETLIRWEVSHNSKYGQPGPLAYKLDTLIINRRIEEAPRPIPRIIRLGSIREITDELGFSTHNRNIKNALYQNAGAFITAKTRFRQTNGTERTIEFGDTRYGVVFTGETLPDGRIADAVYIILHDFYREILDNAITRPLDYDYLRDLAPAAQRLYELLSYQIYAALKNDRARAKLVYSEYCTHAPQTRYVEFDKVKKQMHKIHSVHKKSGYIAKVDFHQTTDTEGQPDWIMLYMPGLKANAEYQTFTKRNGTPNSQIGQMPVGQEILPPAENQLDLKFTPSRKNPSKAKQPPLPSPLVAELVQRGVTEECAVKLVEQYPERIEAQIEFLEWERTKKPGKIADPAAYLVKAIERNNAKPAGFVSQAEQQRQKEARRAGEREKAERRRQEQEKEAAEQAAINEADAYWDSLTPAQQAELDAAAIAQADPETLKLETGPFKSWGQALRRRSYIRQLLAERKAATAEA
jgi:hypothetical protein